MIPVGKGSPALETIKLDEVGIHMGDTRHILHERRFVLYLLAVSKVMYGIPAL